MASTTLPATQEAAYSTARLLNESIVGLAILQMFLSATIPSLKAFQIPVEIVLLTLLLYACTTIRYSRWEVLLLFVLALATALSFSTATISIAMVNAKQNCIAVLSLLYFSKTRFKSALILPTFVISLSLLVLNQIAPEAVAPLISITFNDEFNLSRFGGFFLNAHFNAYFMAIALIYYGYTRRLYGFGIAIMYLTASKFVLVSYLASAAAGLPVIRSVLRSKALIFAGAALGAYLFSLTARDLIEYFDSSPFGLNLGSASVILLQLLDPAYYKILLNPLPSANIDVSADAVALYSSSGFNHDGYIEIGYLYVASQCGIFLGSAYLFTLLKYARHYRVFLLVSLLHTAFVMPALVVYMLVTYSREIHSRNESGAITPSRIPVPRRAPEPT